MVPADAIAAALLPLHLYNLIYESLIGEGNSTFNHGPFMAPVPGLNVSELVAGVTCEEPSFVGFVKPPYFDTQAEDTVVRFPSKALLSA
jgi:hypothetical protein